MMSHRILPTALVLCTLFAACGELPTSGGPSAQSAGAAYDGGYTMGSGSNATVSSGYTNDAGGIMAEEDDGAGSGFGDSGTASTNSTGDTAERGGYTMGSGG